MKLMKSILLALAVTSALFWIAFLDWDYWRCRYGLTALEKRVAKIEANQGVKNAK